MEETGNVGIAKTRIRRGCLVYRRDHGSIPSFSCCWKSANFLTSLNCSFLICNRGL